MYLKLTRIVREAYFDCERSDWCNGKANTRDIFHELNTETILINCDHVASITPREYRYGMDAKTPDRDASSKYLLRTQGACVSLSNQQYFYVTEMRGKIEAAIGTSYSIEVAQ